MNITKNLRRGIFLALFLALFLSSSIIAFATDWWWFSEVGYTQVFLKSFSAKIALFFGAFAISGIFLLINFLLAVRTKNSWVSVLPEGLLGAQKNIDNRLARKLSVAIASIVAILIGLIASSQWQEALKFISGATFGSADPIFGRDIGFFIFSLPALQAGLGLLKFLVILALVGTAILYYIRGSLSIAGLAAIRQMRIDRGARVHLGVLIIAFLLTIAGSIYLSRFSFLTNQSGLVFGATYVDAIVRLPMLWVSLVAVAGAMVSIIFWMKKGNMLPLFGIGFIYLIVSGIGMVVPSLVQKLVVAPNELVKETPYIKHNIAATRQAYSLDAIEQKEISGDKTISAADIKANDLTVKNVRLWDRGPLLSTFSQIQEIRTYYEFGEVDNDRYIIDGEIRQIMLSPRELSAASLPNRNWINERLTFTHGYGVAAGPVNQVTPEGLPVLFVKDLPPKSDKKELNVTRPEIYFGELANDYVVTKTKSLEFDYPKGEENVYAEYTGSGGVELNSFIKRAIYAIKFQSLKLFLSNDVERDSRIMYHRTIQDRVSKIAPFLSFDKDPYAVIADGKIYWIIDAYTTSNLYPYSQPSKLNEKKINYARNSVKAVVDAYDGKVVFYQADANDPIIKTYASIYPDVFRPLSEMPVSLQAHLRYPEGIFSLQTAVYSVYHMDDPQIFYNKEDQWEIPAIASEGEKLTSNIIPAMQPRHIIMKLPKEKKEEYVLMLPFTPRAKDNLSAWMIARNDGKDYGKLMVYSFPKDKLVFGPKQIIGRINQDPVISQQISLWSQGGSQVIQGPLLVIPIEESLLYVRPLYLKAESGKIPELKRVIVAHENKIAMEATLEEGLAVIFGKDTVKKPSVGTSTPAVTGTDDTKEYQELFNKASRLYQDALAAQRAGDWARYGELVKLLEELFRK